jgi:hypothetical protein
LGRRITAAVTGRLKGVAGLLFEAAEELMEAVSVKIIMFMAV